MTQSKSLAEHRHRLTTEQPYSRQGEILYGMHEISRMVTTWFDIVMAEHDITHPQWWAVMHIFENEGLSQSELSRIMRMGRASTGKLLERLEASNWIERRADPADDRVRRIFLSENSLELLNRMREAGIRQFEAFMADVPGDIQESMVLGIRQIRTNAAQSVETARKK